MEGYGIVVFNSSMDYYWAQNGNNVTGCVYDLIRYDTFAALIILAGDLYNVQTQEEIIHRAGRHFYIRLFLYVRESGKRLK